MNGRAADAERGIGRREVDVMGLIVDGNAPIRRRSCSLKLGRLRAAATISARHAQTRAALSSRQSSGGGNVVLALSEADRLARLY